MGGVDPYPPISPAYRRLPWTPPSPAPGPPFPSSPPVWSAVLRSKVRPRRGEHEKEAVAAAADAVAAAAAVAVPVR